MLPDQKPLLSTAFQQVISELPTSSTSAGAGICHGFGPASASLASASAFSSFGDSTSRCWTWILGISEISGLSASDSLTSSIFSVFLSIDSIVLFCRRARFNSSARRLISSCCRCCSSFKLRLTLRAGFARASGFEGGDGEDSWWGGGQELEDKGVGAYRVTSKVELQIEVKQKHRRINDVQHPMSNHMKGSTWYTLWNHSDSPDP